MALITKFISLLSRKTATNAILSPYVGVFHSFQRCLSSEVTYNFETLEVTKPSQWVKQVQINRPGALNSMNEAFLREMIECFQTLTVDTDCRVVVLTGAGRLFTAGLDLKAAPDMILSKPSEDFGRCTFYLGRKLREYQSAFTAIEECPKPVIAAIHNACVGGGVDMVSACDIRYCSEDAWFQIKEVDMGLAADIGTLQRFPKIIGNDSLFRELTYTARKLGSSEAEKIGFVSQVLPDKDSLLAAALETATEIGSKSPIAVQGSKVNIVYSRDHNVAESLKFQASWSAAMLQSEDVAKAVMGSMAKEEPAFAKV